MLFVEQFCDTIQECALDAGAQDASASLFEHTTADTTGNATDGESLGNRYTLAKAPLLALAIAITVTLFLGHSNPAPGKILQILLRFLRYKFVMSLFADLRDACLTCMNICLRLLLRCSLSTCYAHAPIGDPTSQAKWFILRKPTGATFTQEDMARAITV